MKYIGYVLLGFSGFSYAWNANGHLLVAELTYRMLKPQTKQWLMKWQNSKLLGGKVSNFEIDSIWMDRFYSPRYSNLRKLHYVQLPFGDKRFFPKSSSKKKYDALYAINYAKFILSSNHTTLTEKSLAIRVLIHVVADVHQPLHTVNYYSFKFPKGDKGGNYYRLPKNRIAPQLHAYWDQGGGFLKKKLAQYNPRQLNQFQHMQCQSQDMIFNPKNWIDESYQIAIHEAYFPPHQRSQMDTYQARVQKISEQRIFTAACRLAAVFNHIKADGLIG